MTEAKKEAMADAAMRDLIAFVELTEDVPAAADAFKELLHLGEPYLGCDFDADATEIAGKPVFNFYLNERLMRHLRASRAGDGKTLGK